MEGICVSSHHTTLMLSFILTYFRQRLDVIESILKCNVEKYEKIIMCFVEL